MSPPSPGLQGHESDASPFIFLMLFPPLSKTVPSKAGRIEMEFAELCNYLGRMQAMNFTTSTKGRGFTPGRWGLLHGGLQRGGFNQN